MDFTSIFTENTIKQIIKKKKKKRQQQKTLFILSH